jgi:FkbM family methyltransferase
LIDLGTVRATFLHNFHSLPEHVQIEPAVIFDLGSNIGTTLIDFSMRYPHAHIYGFEMDADNYSLARRNTKRFSNVKITNCAIWYQNEVIAYDNSIRQDGYSVQQENCEHTVRVQGKTLKSLLLEHAISSIDYLKMDIEGAEKKIFFEGELDWLNFVKTMNIELHDFNETEYAALLNVLEQAGFKIEKHAKHWNSLYAYKTNLSLIM